MAKDPAFLFYPGDWQGGTATFSRFLKGCYMDVLIAQFNSGPLSLEEIKTVLGSDFGTSWPTLQKKFKCDNSLFFNERLEAEKSKRKDYSKSRSDNRKGKSTYDVTYEKHMIPHMENENENRDLVDIGKGGAGEKVVMPFKSVEFKVAWYGWTNHLLKEHKKPYHTFSAEQAAVDDLAKFSQNIEARAIHNIKYSISKNWKSLHADKDYDKSNTAHIKTPPTITGKQDFSERF